MIFLKFDKYIILSNQSDAADIKGTIVDDVVYGDSGGTWLDD